MSSKKLQFADLALATTHFVPGLDVGLMFWGQGEDSLYEYYAGVFNGSKKNSFNRDLYFLYAARFVYNPLGGHSKSGSDSKGYGKNRLSIAVDAFYNKANIAQDNEPPNFKDKLSLSASVAYKYRGLSLTGEYFNNIDASKWKFTSLGYYLQAAYLVIPKLELALRGSGVFDIKNKSNQQVYTAGINYLLKGQSAKIYLNYSFKIAKQDSQLIQLQAQFYF